MSRKFTLTPIARALAALMSLPIFLAPRAALAATTDLSDVPLAQSSTVSILPNIFFILDDSGSMGSDYMPDYVTGRWCRDNFDDGNSDTNRDDCEFGDPPYNASSFNRQYYNPMVNYTPPKNADGSLKTSYGSPWTAVPNDGYGKMNGYRPWPIDSGSSINLTNGVPRSQWCSNVGLTDCKESLDASKAYVYPDGTYKYRKTVYGPPYYFNATVEWCSNRETSGVYKNFGKAGTCQARKTSTYTYPRYTNWSRVDIVSSTGSYPGPSGTTRSYTEEMTNYANWYAYYRTRLQMAKTAIGQSFSDIRGTPNPSDPLDKNFFHGRVGYTTISDTTTDDSDKFLKIDNFDATHKGKFYLRLYNQTPTSWTPLRAALSKAGQMYAGKRSVDPVQYSCQRNFTILTTDGYWNTNTETGSYGPYDMNGGLIPDLDGKSGVTRPEYDKLGKASTLADVAYYYYHTDLRPSMVDNVPPSGTKTAEDDVAKHQHMTTFTVGMGVDGTLAYQDGYRTATSGDYQSIKQGTLNWPDPINNSEDERIDDLWHAAVNGRGTYFSARDPESLVKGLASALGAMESTAGSGAAAATSNLQPTAGDNFIYIANYRTVFWDGEVSSHQINTSTGAIVSTPEWKAAGKIDAKVVAAGDSDSRTIYTSSGTTRKDATWATLTATEKSYFDNTKLSQYADFSVADKAAATGERLFNHIVRGHHRYEDQDRDSSFGTYNRLYRDRATTLGDIVHAQPVYVKGPLYAFTDAGYDSFKTSNASRDGIVYVAANDGLLHAFDGVTGEERWAYLPPLVTKDLWRLADKDYATNHRFYLDGPLSVTDVADGSSWKTILVGGLGKGGRGYYALDITKPNDPKPLWTFGAGDNASMGYSFGPAMITKVAGKWVAILPSGYNNVPEGSSYSSADGRGHLFVVDALSGNLIKTISTGIGSTGNPSGLAAVNIRVEDFGKDNSAAWAYGGDLEGNMWRFDLVAGTASKVISLGSNQSITSAPEIGKVEEKWVLYFGTGRYLGQTDLPNTQTQSIYGVLDDGVTTISKGSLVKQTVSGTSISNNAVNWESDKGWYLDLPEQKERVSIEPKLVRGTLAFATTIPEATECSPGGSGSLYFLDYRTGSSVDGQQAIYELVSPIVGLSIVELPSGEVKVLPITADGKLPSPMPLPVSSGGATGTGSGKRLMWRELIVN